MKFSLKRIYTGKKSLGEVLLQFTAGGRVVGGDVKRAPIVWLGRLADEFHAGLLGSSAGLTAVTGHTGTDHIFPGMLSAPVARDDVVEGKLACFPAAILAGIVVTPKYLKPAQLPPQPEGTFDHGRQPDYGRYRELTIDRMNKA